MVMKNLKTIIVLLLLVSAFLTSCSDSDRIPSKEKKAQQDTTTVILRGKSVVAGVIIPLTTTVSKNVYKIGDTVWTYSSNVTASRGIINATWRDKTMVGNNFEAFIIEEDNDVMEAINYEKN